MLRFKLESFFTLFLMSWRNLCMRFIVAVQQFNILALFVHPSLALFRTEVYVLNIRHVLLLKHCQYFVPHLLDQDLLQNACNPSMFAGLPNGLLTNIAEIMISVNRHGWNANELTNYKPPHRYIVFVMGNL